MVKKLTGIKKNGEKPVEKPSFKNESMEKQVDTLFKRGESKKRCCF